MAYQKRNSDRDHRGGKKGEAPVKRVRRRRFCNFCVNKEEIDYKDINKLRRFITDRGKIFPRRSTGTCAKHQRKLGIAIKRVRYLGLLPYIVE